MTAKRTSQMKKLIALFMLASCTTVAQTPKPTAPTGTALPTLTATPSYDVTDVIVIDITTPLPTATDYPLQPSLTARPTYTSLPTASDYPTPSQEPSFTPTARPTHTPIPELFRMLELPLPIVYGTTSIVQVYCHFQYNYWVVRPWEMVFHRDDLDGTKETWCIQHNGRIQR